MEDALYWLWLANAAGPACGEAGAILAEFGTAREVWEAMRGCDVSACFSAPAARRLREREPAEFAPLLARCEAAGIALLTPAEPDYPARLRALPDLPLVLYATGSTRCLNGEHYVGMVGTRRPTAYGVRAAHEISLALAEAGAVIVSGLADGLDSEGHKAAVEAAAPTIGFLGTPIDVTYPAANRPLRRKIEEEIGGTVLSEYAPGAQIDRRVSFLQRNRLIAGLSEALCVAEARTHSGTANTVANALRYGRPVFAVPGSIFSPVSEGTNELLANGQARLLRSAGDVLAALDLAAAPAQPAAGPAQPDTAGLTEEARCALAALGPEPRSVTEICQASGLGAGTALAALMELELAGLAASAPGHRFCAAT